MNVKLLKVVESLEPTQELYLNKSIICTIKYCDLLEPTQELYLNDHCQCDIGYIRGLEPTQELYLNHSTTTGCKCDVARTDTRVVFKF